MRVEVIKEFVDKHTQKLHKVGSFFECDEARAEEILSAGAYIVPAPVEETTQGEQLKTVSKKKNRK